MQEQAAGPVRGCSITFGTRDDNMAVAEPLTTEWLGSKWYNSVCDCAFKSHSLRIFDNRNSAGPHDMSSGRLSTAMVGNTNPAGPHPSMQGNSNAVGNKGGRV